MARFHVRSPAVSAYVSKASPCPQPGVVWVPLTVLASYLLSFAAAGVHSGDGNQSGGTHGGERDSGHGAGRADSSKLMAAAAHQEPPPASRQAGATEGQGKGKAVDFATTGMSHTDDSSGMNIIKKPRRLKSYMQKMQPDLEKAKLAVQKALGAAGGSTVKRLIKRAERLQRKQARLQMSATKQLEAAGKAKIDAERKEARLEKSISKRARKKGLALARQAAQLKKNAKRLKMHAKKAHTAAKKVLERAAACHASRAAIKGIDSAKGILKEASKQRENATQEEIEAARLLKESQRALSVASGEKDKSMRLRKQLVKTTNKMATAKANVVKSWNAAQGLFSKASCERSTKAAVKRATAAQEEFRSLVRNFTHSVQAGKGSKSSRSKAGEAQAKARLAAKKAQQAVAKAKKSIRDVVTKYSKSAIRRLKKVIGDSKVLDSGKPTRGKSPASQAKKKTYAKKLAREKAKKKKYAKKLVRAKDKSMRLKKKLVKTTKNMVTAKAKQRKLAKTLARAKAEKKKLKQLKKGSWNSKHEGQKARSKIRRLEASLAKYSKPRHKPENRAKRKIRRLEKSLAKYTKPQGKGTGKGNRDGKAIAKRDMRALKRARKAVKKSMTKASKGAQRLQQATRLVHRRAAGAKAPEFRRLRKRAKSEIKKARAIIRANGKLKRKAMIQMLRGKREVSWNVPVAEQVVASPRRSGPVFQAIPALTGVPRDEGNGDITDVLNF